MKTKSVYQPKTAVYIRAVIGQSFISKLIQWRTDCDIDHVEFAYPFNNYLAPYAIGAQPQGGIQQRPADYLGKAKIEHYVVFLSQYQTKRLNSYINKHLGEPYSYQAIFENALNTTYKLFSRKHRADCSEFVYVALRYAGVDLANHDSFRYIKTITPRDVILSPMLTRV